MSITAAEVKQLRDRTGMAWRHCRDALVEAKGDQEKALELLGALGACGRALRQHRETGEGRIGACVDSKGQVGALVQLRCQSASVAQNDLFVHLANHLARQVARGAATATEELLAQPDIDRPERTVADRIEGVIALVGEHIQPVRLVRRTGLLGSYVHHNGSVGVLLQVEGERADPALLRDVCMHIAGLSPVAVRREQVCKTVLDREHTIIREQESVPPRSEALLERVVAGRFNRWLADNVLLEQAFVKDDSRTVGELLQAAGLRAVGFVRMSVGGP
jgi:elongation factor Ts